MYNHCSFKPVDKKYIPSAVSLVTEAYKEERRALPILPEVEKLVEEVQRGIERLFTQGFGMMALLHKKLVGFLVGYPIESLFGKVKGVYTPLYGHGTIRKDRTAIYQDLYQETAREWVRREYLTHCITLWGHDNSTISTWFWLGFGLRCIDAICCIDNLELDASTLHLPVQKIALPSISTVTEIHGLHHRYYNLSPLFLYKEEVDPFLDLKEWIKRENHHLFAVFDNEKPLGYIMLQPSAESFISNHPSLMNITGVYVAEDRRRQGVGKILLQTVKEFLIEKGYPLCGVDFEAFNVIGSTFWKQYFTPYTLSLQRRIDERIL